MIDTNEVLRKLPKHLLSLIIEQPYNNYTAQDHAVWRYVMRQNIHYLKDVAHESYLEGLRTTGVSIEQIPRMYGMNRILKEIGWAAVAVDGFIPPSAFMEFQAYNVLVIAANIRPIDQIQYTPAPDIIHEAAGHAPIIANQEYAEYLRLFGKYGTKAFSAPHDDEIYREIRHLSILKADPYTPPKEIKKAEEKIALLEKNIKAPSEISQLRNLHWWTVEYGLIGDLQNPKIYGAGLLSSIGESNHALQDSVLKFPYSLDCRTMSFDITTMQPQLFVTPDFETLTQKLEEFVHTMALRTGGLSAIKKAIRSKSIACCVYNTGIQVSGNFTNVIELSKLPVYIQASGPVSLSYNDQEIKGHGKDYHTDGFGSPVGKLKYISERLELFTDEELAARKIIIDQYCTLEFESGIVLKGKLRDIYRKDCKILLMSFNDCTVNYSDEILFHPEWGTYDMAVGESIISTFNGPADPENYGFSFAVPKEKTHRIKHVEETKKLHKLYEKVRDIREKKAIADPSKLQYMFTILKNEHPKDWLLVLEIYELAIKTVSNPKFMKELNTYLNFLKEQHPEFAKLIIDGLEIIKQEKITAG